MCELLNFRTYYNNLFCCIDFPPHWTGIRYKANWTDANSGGIPMPRTEESLKRFSKNPQYRFKLSAPKTEIFISLRQRDGISLLFSF